MYCKRNIVNRCGIINFARINRKKYVFATRMEKAYFNWSSGKDSALALYRAVMSGLYDVRALFSVVKTDGRLAMHEVGEALLRRQADAIGIPFHPFHIDTSWTDAEYAACMSKAVGRFKAQGIATALFGDLYLDGLRRWRKANCRQDGIRAEFPLWHVEPMDAVNEFIRLGFKAVITCVDSSVFDESFVGRTINEGFISDLPAGMDACGEQGEYHSFVYDGPLFRRPVDFKVKGRYCREFEGNAAGGVAKYCNLDLE